jgi:hypothetical protein
MGRAGEAGSDWKRQVIEAAAMKLNLWRLPRPRVWPPWPFVIGMGIVSIAIDAVLSMIADDGWDGSRPVIGVGFLMLLGGYVAYRNVRSHPVFNVKYCEWLECSPWAPGVKTPFGTVGLHWADLLALGLVILYCLPFTAIPWWAPVPLFMILQIGMIMILLLPRAGQYRELLGIYLLGCAMLIAIMNLLLTLALGIFIVAWVLSLVALERSFRSFPWRETRERTQLISQKTLGDLLKSKTEQVGWPHTALAPNSEPPSVSLEQSVNWALFLSVTAFVPVHFLVLAMPDREDGFVFASLIMGLAALIFGLFRLFSYISGRRSSCPIQYRIVHFKWIVPGYDKVFVAPIAIFMIPFLMMPAMRFLGLRADFGVLIGSFLIVLSALCMPPTLRDWHLTGMHSCVPKSWISYADSGMKTGI